VFNAGSAFINAAFFTLGNGTSAVATGWVVTLIGDDEGSGEQ
jgi:hypothetical protein